MQKIMETDSYAIYEYSNTEIARLLGLPENTRIIAVQQNDDVTEVRIHKALHGA